MSARLSIQVEAGTAIDDAATESQRISDMLGVTVEFDFNGVKCLAVIGGDAAALANRQQSEQARKINGPFDYKFATSNPATRR